MSSTCLRFIDSKEIKVKQTLLAGLPCGCTFCLLLLYSWVFYITRVYLWLTNSYIYFIYVRYVLSTEFVFYRIQTFDCKFKDTLTTTFPSCTVHSSVLKTIILFFSNLADVNDKVIGLILYHKDVLIPALNIVFEYQAILRVAFHH